ncbi:hypothetical protein ACFL2R_01175 [Patescibacteria group bacterium]
MTSKKNMSQDEKIMIEFEYLGSKYQCDMLAYRQNRIILPNGDILEANIWRRETFPPKPEGLCPIGKSAIAIKL